MLGLKTAPFLSVLLIIATTISTQRVDGSNKNWRTELEWSRVNFTWPSPKALNRALSTKAYIPENVAMAGIKMYDYRMYVALPRIRPGSPVTLAYVNYPQDVKTNPLLVPYPSWDMNTLENSNCNKLVSVQSMEIDKNGIMWVLDGVRTNSQLPNCPAKLILIDLSTDRVIRTYNFENEVSNSVDGFLSDIVVDNTDGDYAYITESSVADPGLIVYSRGQNTAWKLHDSSMFANRNVQGIRTGGWTQKIPVDVNGIALSPLPQNTRNGERYVYYCALFSTDLYRISTNILKDQELSTKSSWRRQVVLIGNKTDESDGMIMDNKGQLYFGLLTKDGIGRWQSPQFARETPDFYPDISDNDINGMVWPDSFTIDNKGNMFVLANGIHKYQSPDYKIINNDDIKFRIFKLHTGAKSYLYSN